MARMTRQQRRGMAAGRVDAKVVYAVSGLLVVLVAAVLVAGRWAGPGHPDGRSAPAGAAAVALASDQSTASAAVSGVVEVPSVTGLTLKEAKVVLDAAGISFELQESGQPSAAKTDERRVVGQTPSAGTLLQPGGRVVLAVPPAKGQASKTSPGWVVCIDPGHQAAGDSSPEPLGPGSTATKPAMTAGTTGVRSGVPEYEVALQLAVNLKRELESRGVKVVMTRTTNDVSLTNAQRAEIASKARAELFVRLHGDGSPDQGVSGISTVYPQSNKWTQPFVERSRRAAKSIQLSVVAKTGSKDRGVIERGDSVGFNWSKVPSVLVECGYLSNPVEDRLLVSPHYQDKVATGIADGILDYLRSERGR